jgi:hypothetical protein
MYHITFVMAICTTTTITNTTITTTMMCAGTAQSTCKAEASRRSGKILDNLIQIL